VGPAQRITLSLLMAGTRCPIQIDRAAGASAETWRCFVDLITSCLHLLQPDCLRKLELRCPAMSEISTGRKMRARSRIGLLSEGLSTMVSVDGTYTVAAACGAQARIAPTRFGSHL
jgi:hypothetical protein